MTEMRGNNEREAKKKENNDKVTKRRKMNLKIKIK